MCKSCWKNGWDTTPSLQQPSQQMGVVYIDDELDKRQIHRQPKIVPQKKKQFRG
jgi:hypothetical protein